MNPGYSMTLWNFIALEGRDIGITIMFREGNLSILELRTENVHRCNSMMLMLQNNGRMGGIPWRSSG